MNNSIAKIISGITRIRFLKTDSFKDDQIKIFSFQILNTEIAGMIIRKLSLVREQRTRKKTKYKLFKK